MRKLFSALAVVLVFAMAFTITASANTTTVFQPDASGKYTVTYQHEDLKDAMVGMVVIEGVDVETSPINESTIRYIDQIDADENGAISVGPFVPMDKANATKYLVYVGGGALTTKAPVGELFKALAPTDVALDVTSKTLTVGDSANGSVELTATVLPEGATYTAEWTSSVPTVATVVADATNTNKAVVTAVGAGDTVITVKVADGKTATCNVHVELPPANGIAINKTETTIAVGSSEPLKVSLTPDKAEKLPNGETPVYKWSSDNIDVATVDETTGLVTAVAEGNANITVKVVGCETDANFIKTCAVTVTEQPVGVPGDMDGDEDCDEDDAIHLLFHYLIDADDYPLSGDGDVDSSGVVDEDDAIHLLFHYLIDADDYPLYPNK